MATVTMKIEGIEKVLDMLEPKQYQRVVKSTLREATKVIKADLQEYPPEIPDTPYIRTGKLGQGWTSRVTQKAGWIVGVVGNRIGYAPYVQDRARQAEVHQGRWKTAQDVAQDKMDEIVNLFHHAIDKALRLRR